MSGEVKSPLLRGGVIPVPIPNTLVMLHGQIKSPPFSVEARRWTGFLLRGLQRGRVPSMPNSRPMPTIGTRCHELRVRDSESRIMWCIVYPRPALAPDPEILRQQW